MVVQTLGYNEDITWVFMLCLCFRNGLNKECDEYNPKLRKSEWMKICAVK